MRLSRMVPPKKRVIAALAVTTTLVAVGGLAETASATFPGKNGKIVFSTFLAFGDPEPNERCEAPCRASLLRAFNPFNGRTLPFPLTERCKLTCDDRFAAFGPGGRRVAFERLLAPDGSESTASDAVLVSDGEGSKAVVVLRKATSPAWSPSGRALAVRRSGGIRTVRLDGREVRRVAQIRGYDLDWSVRNRIAFTRGLGRSDIYSIGPRGEKLQRLTRDGDSNDPSWSPDGRRIVFTRFSGVYATTTVVMDADGTNATTIARGSTSPAWSPDGKWIAYVRTDRIVIARPDGGDRRVVRRLRRDDAAAGDIAWQALPRRR